MRKFIKVANDPHEYKIAKFLIGFVFQGIYSFTPEDYRELMPLLENNDDLLQKLELQGLSDRKIVDQIYHLIQQIINKAQSIILSKKPELIENLSKKIEPKLYELEQLLYQDVRSQEFLERSQTFTPLPDPDNIPKTDKDYRDVFNMPWRDVMRNVRTNSSKKFVKTSLLETKERNEPKEQQLEEVRKNLHSNIFQDLKKFHKVNENHIEQKLTEKHTGSYDTFFEDLLDKCGLYARKNQNNDKSLGFMVDTTNKGVDLDFVQKQLEKRRYNINGPK